MEEDYICESFFFLNIETKIYDSYVSLFYDYQGKFLGIITNLKIDEYIK